MFVRPSNDPIMLDSIIFTNGKNLFFLMTKEILIFSCQERIGKHKSMVHL